jgi:hypothetical protein
MDPPVCRLCQVKHWSWQGHLWPVEEAPRPSSKPPAKPFPGAKREAKPASVSHTVTHPATKPAIVSHQPMTAAQRRAKWRAAHPEAHRAQQAKAKARKRGSTPKGAK